MIAEHYTNTLYCPPQHPRGAPCKRWWASSTILVGGSIVSLDDCAHLVRRFGVGAVISVESERTDTGRVTVPHFRAPFPDDPVTFGPPDLAVFKSIYQFARGIGAVFYVHCQMGGSRSPAIAYFLLRTLFDQRAEDALAPIRDEGYGNHPFHKVYLAQADLAVAELDR